MTQPDALVIDAVRTPIGKGRPGGALSGVHPVDLLAHALRALVDRAGVDPGEVDDVIGGCVSQIGEQSVNLTRQAVLAAGFPEHVPATTVDRQCGSSQQAVHIAAQGIRAGSYDLAIACGVESMSRVPMLSSVNGADPYGVGVAARYPDGLVHQGISAELIAAKWGISRAELDAFAAESHRRAAEAWAAGRFTEQVTPVKVRQDDGSYVEVAQDEGIRPGTTAEGLAALKPAFRDEYFSRRFPQITWVVTAANASQISDGAAAVLLASPAAAARLGLRARARVHTMTVVGDDPMLMLTAPIPATRRVLDRAGLALSDIDLVEINEAFASVVLAWQRETGADLDRVNVDGGAIALGHPLGASGARLLTTLLGALERHDGRFGLQTMCEGGGMANATIVERV